MDNLIIQTFIEQIKTQQSAWLFALAFLGGIATSLSPCTLGLLPIIVGYAGKSSENSGSKTTLQIGFFVVGLALMLSFLGVSSALTGKALGSHAGSVWTLIMSSFILIMGLNLLEIIEIPTFTIIKQMPQNKSNSLIIYPIMLGGAFALAATPCATPILAAILAYASLKANIALGCLLLFSYALGQGIILIIAGLFASLFKKLAFLKPISAYFMKITGIILIFVSIYIYSKIFGIF